jgi:hypothetical protein
MSFSSFFRNTAETKELHSIVELRSRYYKSNYAKCKAVVLEHAKEIGLEPRHVDDEHKELLLQSGRFHVIVSFVQVTPIETSVDFKVEMYALFGLNRPQKKIVSFYKYLDQHLSFKGVGLHP